MRMSLEKRYLFSAQQFIHVGLFSYFLAFLPMYLKDLSFTATEIVYMGFSATLVVIVGNFITVEYLNRYVERITLLHVMNILSCISFVLFMCTQDMWVIFFIWNLHVFCRVASGVIVDTELVKGVGGAYMKYEHVRLWGSVGFIVMSFILGYIFKEFGSFYGSWFVVIPLVLLCQISAIGFRDVERERITKVVSRSSDIYSLPLPIYLLFFVVCVTWMSHAPLYTYYSLYLDAAGYGSTTISLLWNVGVVSEILMFIVYGFIHSHFSHVRILQISIVLTLIRWLVLSLSTDFSVLIIAQIFHAFSYGAVFLSSVKLSYDLFPEGIKDKSQGYLGVLGVGLGSLLGRLMLSIPLFSIHSYAEVSRLFTYMAILVVCAGVGALFLPSSAVIKAADA